LFIAYSDKFIENALFSGQAENEKTSEVLDFNMNYDKKQLEFSCRIERKENAKK